MAYVHSLVKTEINGKKGWCAPVEIGEATPHYVNFVVPVDDQGDFFHEYICETVTAMGQTKRTNAGKFIRKSANSFVVSLRRLDVWFTVRTVPKEERRLHYLGSLSHPDFASQFVEVEPEEPDKLDQLFEEQKTFIIGCEPFTHYSGIKRTAIRAADANALGK